MFFFYSLEHLGCFLDSGDEQLFTISPGDYLPNELSPISCMLACGKRWQIAGIQNGNVCLCSKSKPTTFQNSWHCSVKCTGISGYELDSVPGCGGTDHISVYDVSQRITGLTMNVVNSGAQLYERTNTETHLVNGMNVEYTFDTGDGIVTNTTETPLAHVYNRPGTFEVSVTITYILIISKAQFDKKHENLLKIDSVGPSTWFKMCKGHALVKSEDPP